MKPVLILSAMLFCIGLYGVLTVKNSFRLFVSVELSIIATFMTLCTFAFCGNDQLHGRLFLLIVMFIYLCQLLIGFGLVIKLKDNRTIQNGISNQAWED